MTSKSALCDEYWAWTAEHGLPSLSAYDLAHEAELTHEERRYIAKFIERWVKMKTQTYGKPRRVDSIRSLLVH